MAIVMSTTIIAITTINSTKVKPKREAAERRDESRRGRHECLRHVLPLRIRRTIGSLLESLGIDIENILPAPTVGLRVVLVTAHTPLRRIGERVVRDAAQQV